MVQKVKPHQSNLYWSHIYREGSCKQSIALFAGTWQPFCAPQILISDEHSYYCFCIKTLIRSPSLHCELHSEVYCWSHNATLNFFFLFFNNKCGLCPRTLLKCWHWAQLSGYAAVVTHVTVRFYSFTLIYRACSFPMWLKSYAVIVQYGTVQSACVCMVFYVMPFGIVFAQQCRQKHFLFPLHIF